VTELTLKQIPHFNGFQHFSSIFKMSNTGPYTSVQGKHNFAKYQMTSLYNKCNNSFSQHNYFFIHL